MSNFYQQQKIALIHLRKIIEKIEEYKELNIDSIILDMLEQYEISEKFIIKSITKFESIGLIKLRGKKILPP